MKVKRAGRWCTAVPSVLCIGGCVVCVVKMQLAVQPLVTLSNVAGSHCSCSTGWFVYYLGGQQKKKKSTKVPNQGSGGHGWSGGDIHGSLGA